MERIESLPPEIELAQLLQRVGAHEPGAFRQLYEKTAPILFARLLRLLRNRHAAEEVLQETFVRAWERAAQYEAGRGRPLTWLVSLARYGAFEYLQRAGDLVEDMPPLLENTGGAARSPNNIDASIAHLSSEARHCLALAYVEGRTPTEIAGLVARPVAHVRRCIRDALLGLRSPLGTEQAA